jgi:hypothetical protein
MGILKTLFGKKGEYPPLDPASVAATSIVARREQLEPFVRKVHGRVEVVPAEPAVYVYLGSPPGDFGMAWFENGREVSFTSLKEDQGVSRGRIQTLSKKLDAAYRRSAGTARYATTIAGKPVVVTPSESLAAEVRQAIDEAVS